jgi:hypothetical protein
MIIGTRQRAQNLRIGFIVLSTMIGLFVFSVLYISMCH